MQLLDFVRLLEGKTNQARLQIVCEILHAWGIAYALHPYATGENLLVKPAARLPMVAIGTHFDVVPRSPGANDNASAIAVGLEILRRAQTHTFQRFAVAFFCFDEEESGLKGSRAYTQAFGVQDLRALYNLELVGQGSMFALWSLDAQAVGKALLAFESAAQASNLPTFRFDQIVTNLADHLSFREAGLRDAFTITCISPEDLAVAGEYYAAQAHQKSHDELFLILQRAPLFKHYHQPTDLAAHLSEECLQMTAATLWEALLRLDMEG